MEIPSQLLLEHSRKNGMIVAQYVNENPNQLALLVELIVNEKVVYQQRASQSLAYLVEYFNFSLSNAFLEKLVNALLDDQLHDAVHRNILKVLDLSENMPEDKEGLVFDYCINQIMNPKSPVAVRAFAIPVAYQLTKKYPDLTRELYLVLEAISDQERPGVLHRKRKYIALILN